MSERLTRRAALRTMAGAVALLPALLAAKPVAAETVADVAIDPAEIMPGTVTMEWGENRWEGGAIYHEFYPERERITLVSSLDYRVDGVPGIELVLVNDLQDAE